MELAAATAASSDAREAERSGPDATLLRQLEGSGSEAVRKLLRRLRRSISGLAYASVPLYQSIEGSSKYRVSHTGVQKQHQALMKCDRQVIYIGMSQPQT